MIEIKDDELLNFLMTSDFSDEYSPEELKYLLLKWRYFYRLLNGKNEQLNYLISDMGKEQETIKNNCINQLDSNKKELEQLRHRIFNLKNKKLSLSERITGKIDIKDETE